MGKDNVPFHTLSFPATILGSGEPWKLVDYIKSFNYLNYEGGKFSTSEGRGVFMDQALEILPSDYWRWWLMANVPEGSDSNFTWESFQGQVNKDLADVLGNFVSRVTKFAAARFGTAVPEGGDYGEAEAAVVEEIARRLAAYEGHMDAIELRKAAQELRAIWVVGNEYLQAAAPWTAIKADRDRAAAITRFSLSLIRLYAVLSRPFLPDASDTMLAALGLEVARLAAGRRRRAPRARARSPLRGARGAFRQDRRRSRRRPRRPLRRSRVARSAASLGQTLRSSFSLAPAAVAPWDAADGPRPNPGDRMQWTVMRFAASLPVTSVARRIEMRTGSPCRPRPRNSSHPISSHSPSASWSSSSASWSRSVSNSSGDTASRNP